MAVPSRLTRKVVERVLSVIRRHERLSDALTEASKQVGFRVSDRTLRDRFTQLNIKGPPSVYLKPVSVDNVRAGQVWTRELTLQARDLLAGYERVIDAFPAISKLLGGHPVTTQSLAQIFQRYKLKTPGEYLKQPAPRTVVEILDEREEKREVDNLRCEVEALSKELENARRRQTFLEHIRGNRGTPQIMPREKLSGLREMTGIAHASDWHVEERVDPAAVAHRNEFNLEIADARVKRFFDAIIWNVEHQRASERIALRDFVLWLGGDLMSGYIHEDLKLSNQLSPTQSIRWLRPRIRDGLLTLLKRLDLASLLVVCSYGNHGRTSEKILVSAGPSNSYEWLMYCDLADELQAEKRIRFEITESQFQYAKIYDWRHGWHHGDSVKYQGGIGGLSVPLLRAVYSGWQTLRECDYYTVGHFHQQRDYDIVAANGSLIGYGAYSLRVKAAFEEPRQLLYYIDKKRGKTMRTDLWVSERAAHAEESAA